MKVMYYIMFFIIGTIFGSFYNVVGIRIPKGESITKPRSHCEYCNHTLKWYELIPLFSFSIKHASLSEFSYISFLTVKCLTGSSGNLI